jgi:divalent metal cation (Fe/Co/Zn/Cd) transporter
MTAVSPTAETQAAVAREIPEPLRRRAIRLEYFTISWNLLEALIALGAGFVAGSIALVGFGLDSIIETISGAALLWRLRQRGEFESHADSRALRIVGLTFFALAAYVGYESVRNLWFRQRPEESLVGIILAAVSLVVMPLLGRAKRGVARELGSRALAADAMETYLCSLLSATLLVGLLLNATLGWWWADPVAALVMVAVMVHEGVEAFRPEEEDD